MTPEKICDVPPELRKLLVPIDKIRSAERNPRRGDVEAIRESLRAHGQYIPILGRRETREALKGNHTLLAAQAEGWTHIAVLWRSVPDDDDARRLLLVDNRTSDLAKWDEPELAALLAEVETPEGTGYTAGDIDRLLADAATSTQESAVPELPAKPRTKPGDLIVLGDHRLVCGDSTTIGPVERVLRDDTIACVWTDPPYGVDLAAASDNRGGRDHGDMAGDGLSPSALYDLHLGALALAREHAHDGAALYLCHADSQRTAIDQAVHDAGWRTHQILIWVKDHFVMGRLDYQPQHEPIIYGWATGKGTHPWYGDRDKTSVVDHPTRATLADLLAEELLDLAMALLEREPGTLHRFAKPHVAEHHPTAKPVGLIARHLRNSTEPGQIVYDPFAGSGSTLIACEETGRHARLLELEPGYCDVITLRWEQLTGRKARRPRRKENA